MRPGSKFSAFILFYFILFLNFISCILIFLLFVCLIGCDRRLSKCLPKTGPNILKNIANKEVYSLHSNSLFSAHNTDSSRRAVTAVPVDLGMPSLCPGAAKGLYIAINCNFAQKWVR